MSIKNFLIIGGLLILISSCSETVFTPKQVAYPRIYLPKLDSFLMFNNNCPYSFEYPNYTYIEKDTFFFEDQIISDCWINLIYPSLHAKVHFSYKEIGRDISLEKVMEDSHELAYTHSKKADYIDEITIETPNKVKGLITEIGGNAANNLQFYLTDYKTHYLRGAVYFNSHPNIDSLQPALKFIKDDLMHVFDTFNWQENTDS